MLGKHVPRLSSRVGGGGFMGMLVSLTGDSLIKSFLGGDGFCWYAGLPHWRHIYRVF